MNTSQFNGNAAFAGGGFMPSQATNGANSPFTSSKMNRSVKKGMEYYYYWLRMGYYTLKGVSTEFQCPFCSNMEYSSSSDLRTHADKLSRDMNVINKYNATRHSALIRYIDVDLSYNARMNLIKKKAKIDDNLESDVKAAGAELFVYPWMVIVANNVTIFDPKSKSKVKKNDGQIKEELLLSLQKKEEELPLKVTALWNKERQTRFAIVEFGKDDFHNARRLESSFQAKRRGKEDYLKEHRVDELYGWMARLDDYESFNYIFGKHLRNHGLLKCVYRKEAEDNRKAENLVTGLPNTLLMKNKESEHTTREFSEASEFPTNTKRKRA